VAINDEDGFDPEALYDQFPRGADAGFVPMRGITGSFD